MPNFNITIGDGCCDNLISFIKQQKLNGQFTVVDVGGSVSGWSVNVIDALIDFNDIEDKTLNQIKYFKCDITHPDSWKDVLQ